ncbi:DUF2087 domain-containing protein [Alloyangia pacifica]|uniref:DUF2087 domain-containing protein n=1 Tax=Alloyangia pacifica TaxID=311180 RepID=A0A1I6PDV4_9RHOB|nr:DUF2087 domain-containing protein [Alloyangia pacifica]SDG25423.1 hypothetical protein SAMN04488245_102170 [Alloyangia pacifica]SFS38353.1 hypothetical protein SAMN04488050_101471 [Alloyangia pacifica]
MSHSPNRETIPLAIDDLSGFARALRAGLEAPPSHQQMLGLIAKAAGYRNFQHLRAGIVPAPKADVKAVSRALRHFDGQGLLLRFPGRTVMQALCLWPLWARIPPRQPFTEREISARIDALCTFRDAAQIRRTMVENRMLDRTRDGSVYTRVERRPSAEALALIAALGRL